MLTKQNTASLVKKSLHTGTIELYILTLQKKQTTRSNIKKIRYDIVWYFKAKPMTNNKRPVLVFCKKVLVFGFVGST